jgi:predicted RNA-binding Zn ribbon-like protein
VTTPGTSPLIADADDFPILGEPLAVELANTRYRHSSGIIDFLGSTDLVTSWFAKAPGAAALSVPTRLSTADADAIRQIRDAAHGALGSLVRGARADTRQVSILNHHAAAAPCHRQLEWSDDSGATARCVYRGRKSEVFRAQLAGDVIAFLGGPNVALVRRCAHPDCEMFFVQHHHKRRFCHESCAHRARQARYYLATRAAGRDNAAERPAAGR